MDELKNLKLALAEVKNPDKIIIEEMIKEVEVALKKPGAKKREIIFKFHDDINILVISEPTSKTFQMIKSRLDEIVSVMR